MINMDICITFNEEKAVQVAAHIMRELDTRSMDRLRLVKLLYLVDREAFSQKDRPVVGGRYVSMPYGPVTSEFLNLIKYVKDEERHISEKYLKSESSRRVVLLGDPGEDLLSRREIRIIDDVVKQYRDMSTFQLRDFTHRLPEYEDPHGSSSPIPIIALLEAVGRSRDEAEHIIDEILSVQYMAGLNDTV